MRETCFCGWSGDVEDRTPVAAIDGRCGLVCPSCGHLDLLDYLPPSARLMTIAEVVRRYTAHVRQPSDLFAAD